MVERKSVKKSVLDVNERPYAVAATFVTEKLTACPLCTSNVAA
jgi:hypothetical protein